MSRPLVKEVLEISLTKGFVATVDASAWHAPYRYYWKNGSTKVIRPCDCFWSVSLNGSGRPYVVTRTPGAKTRLHRLLTSAPVDLLVDHIDGNGLNNCCDNLRLCTNAENCWNQGARSIGNCGRPRSSQYKGVNWSKQQSQWQSSIMGGGRKRHLGFYDSELDAALAYDEAARMYHGEFARPNFTEDVCLVR